MFYAPFVAGAVTVQEPNEHPAHRSGMGASSLSQMPWGAISVGLTMYFGIWIFALHRKLRLQKVALCTLRLQNASLENHLSARTDELQKNQSELIRAGLQDRDLSELKSRFITMVSHEFRTPLGIIMSAIELMRHHGDRIPAEQLVELQDDIHDATRQMAGLMERVLAQGQVETDGEALPSVVDLECQISADSA